MITDITLTQSLGRFHLSFERSRSRLWVEKQNFFLEKNKAIASIYGCNQIKQFSMTFKLNRLPI
ncbi:hypothetical protein [Nostoc sp. C117]|uniref:hypothetical protein n=1 Tax=Nostoc sp. C117 TaxID=3349875 RepID=UPI00370D4959